MGRRSRFSLEERRRAVAATRGDDIHEPARDAASVAGELGVSPRTIYRWRQELRTAGGQGVQESTRARLLRACRDELRRRTYGEITVEDVARAAGVSERAAFDHFAGRRALFAAAIGDAVRQYLARLGPYFRESDSGGPPLVRLRVFLRAVLDAAEAVPDGHVVVRDLGVPEAEDIVEPWHEGFERLCAGLLTEAAAAGDIAPDVNVSDAAAVLERTSRALIAAYYEGLAKPAVASALERLPDLVSR